MFSLLPTQHAVGETAQDSAVERIDNAELATTMVTRGAVAVLIGAACAPKGKEATWAAGGFVVGTLLGQPGIVAIALAALWKKADG